MPLRRSCMENKHITHQEYTLNTNETIQIIWRAALIDMQMTLTDSELQEFKYDKNIG